MAEYELIESRTISGKGVLKIPADKKENRVFILYADVVRPPKNSYGNFNYNPVRGKYGFLTFLRGGYVINSASIDYRKQAYNSVNDYSGQTLIAIKCMYRGIMDMFDRLENALTLPPLTTEDLIKDYENLRLSWDECRLVAYADSGITLRLYSLSYDICTTDFNADIPFPSPPSLPDVPSGTPIEDISPAYDGEDDGGSTQPFDTDSVPPENPDLGGECEAGTLKITVTVSTQGFVSTGDIRVALYGPVSQEFRVKPGSPNILEGKHRGYPSGGGCLPQDWREITSYGALTTIQSWANPIFPGG